MSGGRARRESQNMTRLERLIGVVLRVGVSSSSVCLAAGLALSFRDAASPSAAILLQTGVLVLLVTPFVRVVVSIVQYVRERNWPFVTLTTIVLVELMASAVAALVFNRKP